MSTFEVNGKSYTSTELLKYWIKERERIRVLKEDGEPKPWTDDHVFQSVYFCNVHREDDKVTKWIRENYTHDFFNENYELAIVAARIFNRPQTLAYIQRSLLDPDFPATLRRALESMRDRSMQIWSGAYVITTHGMKMPKLDYCVALLENAAKNYLPVNGHVDQDSCERYHWWLQQIDGLGSFLAAQVVADLKNTPMHPLERADDWMYFCAPGPGSLRGLSWYWDMNVTNSMFHDRIHMVADDLGWEHCMQDLQNCLCEFDKYCRVLTGAGRSKRVYHGRG